MREHIICALVENKPGVLQRVSGLFRRRNFNIESISVGHSEREGYSRITLSVVGDDKILEQVRKQLSKLVEVIKVTDIPPENSVIRELALIKVSAENLDERSSIIQLVEIFRAKICDVSSKTLTIEITGSRNKIDAFIELVRPYGIKELARTGITAVSRG